LRVAFVAGGGVPVVRTRASFDKVSNQKGAPSEMARNVSTQPTGATATVHQPE
jgi:hypothetical protein